MSDELKAQNKEALWQYLEGLKTGDPYRGLTNPEHDVLVVQWAVLRITELEQQVEWFKHNHPDNAVKYDFMANRIAELEQQLQGSDKALGVLTRKNGQLAGELANCQRELQAAGRDRREIC